MAFTDPARPRRALAEGEYLAEMASFSLRKEDREAKTIGGMPVYLWRLIDGATRLTDPRCSKDHVVAFCLRRGVKELQSARFAPIKFIAKLREQVQGDDSVSSWFDDWDYDLELHQTKRCKPSARVDPKDHAIAAKLAEDLGLEKGTLISLALMTVLITFPLPEQGSTWMVDGLLRFQAKLHDRLAQARKQASIAAPGGTKAWTWDEVLQRKRGGRQ
jgi:hypothetical protein